MSFTINGVDAVVSVGVDEAATGAPRFKAASGGAMSATCGRAGGSRGVGVETFSPASVEFETAIPASVDSLALAVKYPPCDTLLGDPSRGDRSATSRGGTADLGYSTSLLLRAVAELTGFGGEPPVGVAALNEVHEGLKNA